MRRMLPVLASVAIAAHAGAARAADEADVPSAPKSATVLRGALAGGATYGSVWGLGSNAKRLEGGITLDFTGHVGGTFFADVDLGATHAGLASDAVTAAVTVDLLLFDRLRLGIGPELTYAWMSRAKTSSLASVDSFGPGLRAAVAFDLVRFDERIAVFAGASARADSVRGTRALLDFERGAPSWRAGGVAGLRF